MGFKQREKKRRKKAATLSLQQRSRETGSSARKWWRTIVSTKGCCAQCGGILKPGVEMVYRREPGEMLCLACAEKAGIRARPSLRWEKWREQQLRASRKRDVVKG